jgi:hypothetical protein
VNYRFVADLYPDRGDEHNGGAEVVLGVHDVPGARQPSIQEPVPTSGSRPRSRASGIS